MTSVREIGRGGVYIGGGSRFLAVRLWMEDFRCVVEIR
jgi:hypothetical protein